MQQLGFHLTPNHLMQYRKAKAKSICKTQGRFKCIQGDEDMTPTHMTMFGTWYGGVGGQQGCPSQEGGGPRLIRFESPRWRPKATQV